MLRVTHFFTDFVFIQVVAYPVILRIGEALQVGKLWEQFIVDVEFTDLLIGGGRCVVAVESGSIKCKVDNFFHIGIF